MIPGIIVIYFNIWPPYDNSKTSNCRVPIICGSLVCIYFIDHWNLCGQPQLIGKHHPAEITAQIAFL